MWIEFALIGLLSGYLAGFLGIGGGIVVVPALTFLFLKEPATAPWAIHMAVATSLAVMLVTSMSSLLAHHRKKAIHWPLVQSMAAGLMAGAILGAALAAILQGEVLIRVFGLFAILAGFQLILSPQTEGQKPLPGQPSASIAGGSIGLISALVGIGGGSMTVPWLLWHGVQAQKAVATSAACGYPIAIAGTLSFVLLGQGIGLPDDALGYVNLPAFAGIAIFGAGAAPLGALTVHRLSSSVVRRIFGLFLTLVGAQMLLNF